MNTLNRWVAAGVSAAAVTLAFCAGPASAIELTSFGGAFINPATGLADLQAGAHPDYRVKMTFPGQPGVNGGAEVPKESLRTVEVALPPGLVGNPLAASTCERAALSGRSNGTYPDCPIESQVGYAEIQLGSDAATIWSLPVYNLDRPTDRPGEFGFNFLGSLVRFAPQVRSSDYRVVVEGRDASQAKPIFGVDLTMWGVPADGVHDAKRWDPTAFFGFGDFGASSAAPRKSFMTSPTACDGSALPTDIRVDSWQSSGVFVKGSFSQSIDGVPVVFTGCEKLGFAPRIDVAPTGRAADAPAGLEVDLRVPKNDHPDGLATAHVKDVKMLLPHGMSVSPASAAGLGACAPGDIGIGTDDAASCPRSSKLGTVTVETPLLEEPLTGDVILATPDQNPFGSLVALYIVAEGPGVRIKLPGRVDLDPVSGQLTATFSNNPQLPFSALKVRFDGGENASLATPAVCGRYETKTTVTSWSGKSVDLTSPMAIEQGCEPRGFTPGVSAGSTVPAAGKGTGFAMTIERPERQQNLAGVGVEMPSGLLARLKGVPLCPEANATAGSCSAGSQIGTTQVLSGPGAAPLAVGGHVHLTGPYKGGPYGLSIVVPTAGQAGPFDLGAVVVRAAIHIDRTTAAVTVKADPLPLILRGIPLRLRQVKVLIDRPGFMINPSNCGPKSITTAIDSAAADATGMPLVGTVNAAGAGFAQSVGATVRPAVPFHVGGCRDLDFAPKLAMALTGKGQTSDGKHPGLTANLTQLDGGQANNKKVSVALPLSLALDPDNANGLCEPADAAGDKCPARSIVGRAHAISPVLNQPLDGPVYFVRGERKDPKSGRTIRTLPKLYVPLTGEHGIKVDLHASSEVKDERLVTTFDNIPDAPVTDFTLSITGGKHGILVVSNTNVCKSNQQADSLMDAQNGAELQSVVSMTTPCSLALVKSSHTKSTLNVTVGGLGAGKVTVSGKGLSKKSRALGESTVATVAVPMTSKTRTALARGRNVKVTVAVKFLAKGSKKAKTVKKTLTIHGAKKKS